MFLVVGDPNGVLTTSRRLKSVDITRGGSRVREGEPPTLGPDSVGYRLTDEALVVDGMLGHDAFVLTAAAENPAMDLRMQGLHPSSQNGRI